MSCNRKKSLGNQTGFIKVLNGWHVITEYVKICLLQGLENINCNLTDFQKWHYELLQFSKIFNLID